MKFLSSVLTTLRRRGSAHHNVRMLGTYVGFLAAMITAYSILFHVLMAYEGRDHSWLTGFYWTLTVMSTLGFGDITFQSDLGRLFSIVVLLTGIVALLVVLPFVFIEFFYAPFIKEQTRSRAPREIPERTNGHVIITSNDPVTRSLIGKLDDYGYPYVMVVDTVETALELVADDVNVMVGALDDPQTYRNARANAAALLVTTASEVINTNITFTVRELAPKLRIVSAGSDEDAIDILHLAGADRVLDFSEMLGIALARRTIAGDALAHPIGEFGNLVVAEAAAAGTPLVGRTLAQIQPRQLAGIHVVGVWERGTFGIATPETRINEATVLVLAGTKDNVQRYNTLFRIYHVARGRVVILGAGRVGQATARELERRGVDYCLVEKDPGPHVDPQKCIVGNAIDRDVLDRAGIGEAPAVLVTTHDDDINIYLTIYCRRLRPDIQIVSRATVERNVSTLHRAGADFVMSYANMGASAIFNYLERCDILTLAEGLTVSRLPVPPHMAGQPLDRAALYRDTGCYLLAAGTADDFRIDVEAGASMPAGGSLVIVGDIASEKRFLERYSRA
ncbi:MAG: TrkA family potassium uptake protein [Gammaproteobacteria bacterium]